MRVTTQIYAVSLIMLISACSSSVRPILPDRQVEYKRQNIAVADLEVPPDLTKSSVGDNMPVPVTRDAATYSQYSSNRQNGPGVSSSGAVLPEVANVKIMRDGNQRWLEIQLPPAQVWNKVLAFWRDSGIVLAEQNPAIGVMRTDWLENRADIQQNFITDFLRRALDSLYSAATRDQFRVWLEPGATPGSTYLYLAHRGLEEKMLTSSTSGEKENSYWVSRPSDPGLEAEILRRIMVYFGVAEQAASSSLAAVQDGQVESRAELQKTADGSAILLVKADFAAAWRLVGIALERVGLTVEDRDRTTGLYSIQYDDPLKEDQRGFFERLAFWRSTEKQGNTKYRLQLVSADDATKVVVLNSNGQPEQSATAIRILTLIQEQIR